MGLNLLFGDFFQHLPQMLCVHSLTEILPYELEEIADRDHYPIQVILTDETLVDANNGGFFALGVRTDVGEGDLFTLCRYSHPRHSVDYVARRNRIFRPYR